MTPWVCSVTDHRSRQNVVRTLVTNSPNSLCATLLFLPHFDVICDLLPNRQMATWNPLIILSIPFKFAPLFAKNPVHFSSHLSKNSCRQCQRNSSCGFLLFLNQSEPIPSLHLCSALMVNEKTQSFVPIKTEHSSCMLFQNINSQLRKVPEWNFHPRGTNFTPKKTGWISINSTSSFLSMKKKIINFFQPNEVATEIQSRP